MVGLGGFEPRTQKIRNFLFLRISHCTILVHFFTDFFTKQNKKQATLGNPRQPKMLKNMTEGRVGLDPESGVLPLDDLPPVAAESESWLMV